jgi:hypothetical protein
VHASFLDQAGKTTLLREINAYVGQRH